MCHCEIVKAFARKSSFYSSHCHSCVYYLTLFSKNTTTRYQDVRLRTVSQSRNGTDFHIEFKTTKEHLKLF